MLTSCSNLSAKGNFSLIMAILMQMQIMPYSISRTSAFILPDDWIIEGKRRTNKNYSGTIDKVPSLFSDFVSVFDMGLSSFVLFGTLLKSTIAM